MTFVVLSHICQLQLLKSQVSQRPLDAKPSQWLTFRPSPTPAHGFASYAGAAVGEVAEL